MRDSTYLRATEMTTRWDTLSDAQRRHVVDVFDRWDSRPPEEKARDAALTFVLSGTVLRRLSELEDWLPSGPTRWPSWLPRDAGRDLPAVDVANIRALIATARRHTDKAIKAAARHRDRGTPARHSVAARRAYDEAARAVEAGRPTLRFHGWLLRLDGLKDTEAVLNATTGALAKFRRGKPRGGTDALGRVLLDILPASDPRMRMHAKDVWAGLRAKVGKGIVLAVDHDRVIWSDGRTKKPVATARKSISNRLATLRRARLLGRPPYPLAQS